MLRPPRRGSNATKQAEKKPVRQSEHAADGKYYVAEGTCTVTLNSSIITGVDRLAESPEVRSVHYVNAIGQVADKSWKGVNIVVTRYTDGTQSTTKVLK